MKDVGEKISKTLLFLVLFLIPTQLGKHFWFDWSSVLGIRIDYLSPTLYLVDLVWVGLVIFRLLAGWAGFQSLFFNKKNIFRRRNLIILAFVVINILVAQNRWVAVYKWLRIGQLGWFGWYVSRNKNLVEKMMAVVLPVWIVVESLLAIAQIAKGGSLNGFWWWLGERSFDFNTIGIAQMSVVNNGIIRAYGTFSHPNSLAGFLLVGLLWWVKKKPLLAMPLLPLTKGRQLADIWWWGVMWLGVIGIILTGSRTVWFLGGVSLVWLLWRNFRNIKDKARILILILVLVGLVYKMIDYNYLLNNFLSGWDENGLLKRGQLNLAAIEMIKKSPLFGVGANNFLVNLPEYQKNNQIFWFQPVHNIILLLVSEVGLIGIVIFGLFAGRVGFQSSIFNKMKKVIKEKDKILLLIFGVILVSGMVDHYWFTLPQNMWLLALILGMV